MLGFLIFWEDYTYEDLVNREMFWQNFGYQLDWQCNFSSLPRNITFDYSINFLHSTVQVQNVFFIPSNKPIGIEDSMQDLISRNVYSLQTNG